MMSVHKIGIIGCGLTGAITSVLLKQNISNLKITILEKSRGAGGRMSTARSKLGSQLDLGLQFITKSPNLSEFQEKCYAELLSSSLIKPLQEKIEGLKESTLNEHFVCSNGSGSIVKHFLQKAGCEVFYESKVTEISILDNKWQTICENGTSHTFDSLILTMPIPQVLQLKGVTSHLKDKQEDKLKSVEYCSRFALGYFLEDISHFKNIPWSAKFFKDDIIRYISLDYRHRNNAKSPTIVIHSTKDFGQKHLDGGEASQNMLYQALQKLVPELHQIISGVVPEKIHKWRYSQVERKYDGDQGCLVVSTKPLLISGGDGFTKSTFEGCIQSAEDIVKNIVTNFGAQ